MREKTITVYKFSELTPTVQERVLDKMRDWQVDDYNWYESEIDYWKEKLDLIGFENAEIAFSGFYSQGDGASFTADINSEKIFNTLAYCAKRYDDALTIYLAEKLYQNDGFKMTMKQTNSRYSHERTVSVNIDIDYRYRDNRFWTNIMTDFEYMLDMYRIDLCHAIYKSLETGYEHLTSDESIIEMIKTNEYEFTIDGKFA